MSISASNRVKLLNIDEKFDKQIIDAICSDKAIALGLTCVLINNYFDAVKHNQIQGPMAALFAPVALGCFESSQKRDSFQDDYDQSALYYNLYPGSFNKIASDMMDYYNLPQLQEAIDSIIQHAKDEDGPYEDMLRKQGIVEPF